MPGNNDIAERSSDATIRAWEQVSRGLVNVLGEAGFRALYRRSLHLTSARYPWLAPQQTSLDDAPIADLKLRLDRETPSHAADASRALLATLTRLLNDLIGEALTTRMLMPIVRDAGAADHMQEKLK